MSFVATLPDDRREEILARVRGLAGEAPGEDGFLDLAYRTDLYWCAKVVREA
jgi:hypothetical protein